MTRKLLVTAAVAAAVVTTVYADMAERLKDAQLVLTEMAGAGDKGIPTSLLQKAECMVIVPNLKKGAFVVGGQYGKGFLSCRQGKAWSAPGAIKIEGGSFGLQIGGSSTDVILLVMNQRGVDKLLSSQFKVGADAAVAAGPIG